MTLRQELKDACKVGREEYRKTGQFCTVIIADVWGIRVETVRNTPRGGPMAAWKYLYYLLPSPIVNANVRLGGYDRSDSFCSWAAQYIEQPKAEIAQ